MMRVLRSSKKLILFEAWLIIVLLATIPQWFVQGDMIGVTVGISTFICGISTLLFWLFRDPVTGFFARIKISSRRRFILVGGLGALWAEFVFWLFEKVFGVIGVAAHPDLLIDFAVTMPWYLMMVALMWKMFQRYDYSIKEIFFLGAIYQLGADGIFGSLAKGILDPWNLALIIVLYLPIFAVIYSVIVIPSSYVLKKESGRGQPRKSLGGSLRRYVHGLMPLLGLIPYFALYMILYLIAMFS